MAFIESIPSTLHTATSAVEDFQRRLRARQRTVAAPPAPAGPREHVGLYLAAAGIAAVGGARSTLPATLIAIGARLDPGLRAALAAAPQPWQALADERAALGASLASVGEVSVDKAPQVPSRFSPPEFLARLGIGAFAASAIIGARRGYTPENLIPGALVGAGAAGLGALAGSALRGGVATLAHGVDLPGALVEDTLAISLGALSLWALLKWVP